MPDVQDPVFIDGISHLMRARVDLMKSMLVSRRAYCGSDAFEELVGIGRREIAALAARNEADLCGITQDDIYAGVHDMEANALRELHGVASSAIYLEACVPKRIFERA